VNNDDIEQPGFGMIEQLLKGRALIDFGGKAGFSINVASPTNHAPAPDTADFEHPRLQLSTCSSLSTTTQILLDEITNSHGG